MTETKAKKPRKSRAQKASPVEGLVDIIAEKIEDAASIPTVQDVLPGTIAEPRVLVPDEPPARKPNVLVDAVIQYKAMRQALLDEFPDLEHDLDALQDTAEGLTDLPDLLIWFGEKQKLAERHAAAVKAHMEALKARHDRHGKSAERLKGLIFSLMQAASIPDVKRPHMTLRIGRGDKQIAGIIDVAKLPDHLVRKKEPEPDKVGLKTFLKEGGKVDGLSLVDGEPFLVIKI